MFLCSIRIYSKVHCASHRLFSEGVNGVDRFEATNLKFTRGVAFSCRSNFYKTFVMPGNIVEDELMPFSFRLTVLIGGNGIIAKSH